MYDLRTGEWRTPKGNVATFTYRSDTSDWNTLQSCTSEDEYDLRDLDLEGWALDIGAHVGGVTVALALDNPTLHVLAVEPVPSNADLLRRNVLDNGLAERVIVIEGAAGAPGQKRQDIAWGHRGDAMAEHHAFIGNTGLATEVPHETADVRSWTLGELQFMARTTEFVFAKIDCEGCEAGVLRCPGIGDVREWRGEWHPPHVDETGIHALLDASHDVTTWGPAPGGFRAVRR